MYVRTCYRFKDVNLEYSIYLLKYLHIWTICKTIYNLVFMVESYISFISDLSEKFVELTHWTS